MKNAKKPSRAQYYFLGKKGFAPSDWRVVKDTPTEMHITQSKLKDGEARIIKVVQKKSNTPTYG